MRKIFKTLIYIALITFSASCSKWLDVQPKTQIKGDAMFESEAGFKEAIIGCYIKLSEDALYGKELGPGMVEFMAQQYDFLSADNINVYRHFHDHNYEQTRGTSDRVWDELYNVIANLNYIIENLELKKDMLSPSSYNVLKGETLGLRAFLHFELVRLFCYGNIQNQPEVLDKPAIPYRHIYDHVQTEQSTLKETLELISADLAISREILQKYDPFTYDHGGRPDDYYAKEEDAFFMESNRIMHFNYKAANVLAMRILMYEGSAESLDSVIVIGEHMIASAKLPWVGQAAVESTNKAQLDYMLSSEMIFGIETFQRYQNIFDNMFLVYKDESTAEYNTSGVGIETDRCNDLYDINNGGELDFRFKLYRSEKGDYNQIERYYEDDMAIYKNNMPLMRTPEVYLMVAEALNSRNNDEDKATAIEHINTYRGKRGLLSGAYVASELTKQEVDEIILKEYQREFIAEGVMFYYYKRLGFSSIGDSEMNNIEYMLPIPNDEIDFGYIDNNR